MNWFGLTSKKKKKKSPKGDTLSDVVRGIQHAVNTSIQSSERHHIETMQRFFETKDGKTVPKTIDLEIASGQTITVPLVTLMNQNNLMLDEMNVKMAIEVRESKRKKTEGVERTSFSVTPAPNKSTITKGNIINVEMNFKSGDSPEGVERIVEMLTNTLQPKGT